jgi:hypothetical protein
VRLECEPLREEIPDERSAPAHADRRSELQKRRLREPAYREASLRGLAKATEACSWSDEAIVEAIRSFYRKQGRLPKQADFRSAKGLPGYGTVWRRFGSTKEAVAFALREGAFERGADRSRGDSVSEP